jgi:hypothetical protein
MGEIAPLVRRPVQPLADKLYHEIGVRSFGKGIFHKAPTTGLEIGGKRVFSIEPGDLLFNIVFAWEGAVAVAAEAERWLIGSHWFRLNASSTIRPAASSITPIAGSSMPAVATPRCWKRMASSPA